MSNATATADKNLHGVHESNGLVDGQAYHKSVDYGQMITLPDLQARGGKITRLRFLTEYIPHLRTRMYDISYCHGTLPDGTIVPVQIYMSMVPKFKVKGELINIAKAEKVFAKGIGLLDEGNWSVLS